MNTNKEDIKWFEHFFDIVFVVGIGVILNYLYQHINDMNIIVIVGSMIMALLLFNTWVKVMMLENKIKVFQRVTKNNFASYTIYIFGLFFATIMCLFYFAKGLEKEILMFLCCYFLIALINYFIFNFSPIKMIIILLLITQTVFIGYNNYILLIILLIMMYDFIFIYKNLNKISNAIFNELRFKPSVKKYLKNIPEETIDKMKKKVYIPHLIERLGIVMIVFMAEYVMILFMVLKNAESPFIFGMMFFLLVVLFYYDFYSVIEHYDESLILIENKEKRYKKAKKTTYLTILYYISISAFTFYIKNIFNEELVLEFLVIGFFGLLTFEIANISLLFLYDDIIADKKLFYISIKIIGILFSVVLFLLYNHFFFLVGIIINFIINALLGRYLTKVNYSLK